MSTRPRRTGRAGPPFQELSVSEAATLAMAAAGLGNVEIAVARGLDVATVTAHLRQARWAVGLTTERQLLAWYVRRLCFHALEQAAQRGRLEEAS